MIYHFFAGRNIPAAYAPRFPRSHQQRGFPGPDNMLGCLVCRHAPLAGCDSSTLSWQQLAPDWWIAVTPGDSPADFARRPSAAGQAITLADGATYLIPVADPEAAACSLPLAEGLAWDAQRQARVIARAPLPQHDALARLATRAATSLRLSIVSDAAAAVNLDDDQIRELIHLALSVNYDLLPEEILALRLIHEDRRNAILSIIIDLPGILSAISATLETAARPFAPCELPPPAPAPSASPPLDPPAPTSSFLRRLFRRLRLDLALLRA